MHIPDAYLSPITEGTGYCVMVPLWAIAARRTAKTLQTRMVPTLAVGSAFCFAIQMFNVPAAGGTTAHALGATLLAILVGPWAALIGVSLSLAVQALLFGDGGVLSYGINCFNMGFVASFVGWSVYRLCGAENSDSMPRRVIAASAGAYVGTVAASLSAGILLGIQPMLAHDAAGHALYFPLGLSLSVPGMVISHLIAAGPADAVVTAGALAYLARSVPELISRDVKPKLGSYARLSRAFLWVIVVTPIGLIAAGDAWGEWDLDRLKRMVGYAPSGIARADHIVHPPLQDYGFSGAVGTPLLIAGYVISALIGCGLVALVARALIRGAKPASTVSPERNAAQNHLPEWMLADEPPMEPKDSQSSDSWIEKTLLKLRVSVERTIAAEMIAHGEGVLQRIQPEAKAVGFLLALIGVGVSQSTLLLGVFLTVAFVLAWRSGIPIEAFALRVFGVVAFFGIPVLASALLMKGSSLAADRTLLRLGAGISLAITWTLTTRWTEMIRALQVLRVPGLVLSTALLTYRYIFVLVETASEMVTARAARQVGNWSRSQARGYAGSASAILFAKSMGLTEEIHQAMSARGLDVGLRHPQRGAWRGQDYGFAFAGAGCLAAAIVSGALHVV